MKSYSFFVMIVVLFNYYICSAYAENENNFYIVGIRRSDDDDNYDKASERVQNAINELVNDRLNDIYEIIEENKETFVLEDGKMDEKLQELDDVKVRRKRNNESGKKVRFRFINPNQPENNRPFNKRELESEDVEYIPMESKIVGHICPINNYYVVKAYLSPEIVADVEKLDNVVYVEKSTQASNEEVGGTYYDIDSIQEETKWLNVSVQEHDLYEGKNLFSHLSLISQGRYSERLTKVYDNNYYYPTSGGKDIDIYLIDEGIFITNSQNVKYDDYDTYEGTADERVIDCAARIVDGTINVYPPNTTRCFIYNTSEIPSHGNMVSSVAGGTLYGAAKKANIHMLATAYEDIDELAALYYIKRYGRPHKTIVSISRGHYNGYRKSFDDLLNELVAEGMIFFTSAGNRYSEDCCADKRKNNFKNFSGYDNMITVGAITNTIGENMNNVYKKAEYSNSGKCIFIHAPGQVIYPPVENKYESYNGLKFIKTDGTSCASPLVAGVAATIMSEYPEIKFTTRSIKEYLKDYALNGVIEGLVEGTPNRLLNNGKRTIYSPSNTYNGCGERSGRKTCSTGCCTKDSKCIEPSNDKDGLCEYHNGVQYAYGAYSLNGELYPSPYQEIVPEEEPLSNSTTYLPGNSTSTETTTVRKSPDKKEKFL
ncbi:subtilisin-like protein [Anaeromyces robustus]|uniref:Subtilisin-like protein n=1 Tax=Anaeromyces robustus TaxID=1754192 RepID=A0A1Y1WNW6_9FUNG|nr:subtilisin-like protein [Anaeromyces robustus]|eukprot:ORX75192.1 subtilisin-like protein [Anaeromyces robustus]